MVETPSYDDVAVLVPCYNEEPTVGKVVTDFRAALPGAQIYVFDNNSSDKTAELAKAAGATVVHSPRQGKGSVVRHMFATVAAPYYVMVDGDDTYPADAAPALVALAKSSGADMVVGTRMNRFEDRSFRRFHQFGNRLVAWLISKIFGSRVSDVLSGYRVFAREFVQLIPLSSTGFEIETELTVKATAKNFRIEELPIQYGVRPEGSYSKLSTFGDGFLIIKLIFMIFKDFKPFTCFGVIGLLIGVLAWVFSSGVLALVSVLTVAIGVMLHTIRRYHDENFEVWRKYLGRPDP